MRYRLMATYRGAPYEAGIGPEDGAVVLFAACPPPEELGFEPATGHWRKELRLEDVQAVWQSRPVGKFRGDSCIVLDDLGDRLHIGYLGHDAYRAEQLGYWQVDRGVFELVTARDEVTDIVEERTDYQPGAAKQADYPSADYTAADYPSMPPMTEPVYSRPASQPDPAYPAAASVPDRGQSILDDGGVMMPPPRAELPLPLEKEAMRATEQPLPLEAEAMRAASAASRRDQPAGPGFPAGSVPAANGASVSANGVLPPASTSGPVGNGPAFHGPVFDGAAFDGAAVNGSAVNGSAVNGSFSHGPSAGAAAPPAGTIPLPADRAAAAGPVTHAGNFSPAGSFTPAEANPSAGPIVPGAPVANGGPIADGGPHANGSPMANASPIANGGPIADGTPVANGSPMANGTPIAKGSPIANGSPMSRGGPVGPMTSAGPSGASALFPTPVAPASAFSAGRQAAPLASGSPLAGSPVDVMPQARPAPAPAAARLGTPPLSSPPLDTAVPPVTMGAVASGSEQLRRRRAGGKRLDTERIFAELASLATIPATSYSVGEEVDGAMCLLETPDGFEVFSSAAGARHEVRTFPDEESACFYLFGVLAADAVRTGVLVPGAGRASAGTRRPLR